MVIHVYEFMGNRTFHMLLAEEITPAQYDSAWIGREASCPRLVAWST